MAGAGGRELRALALAMKRAGNKPMGQRLRKRLTAATDDFAAEVKQAFVEAMPNRGGYSDVIEQNFRVRVSVRSGSADARVSAIGYADGTKERRDLPRLEAGILRHPVFGRSRLLKSGARKPTPWATTKVPAGAWADTVDKTWTKVNQQMRAVIDELADEIMKG